MQYDLRPGAAWSDDFNTQPADISSPAAPERFHRCFLRCKTRGVTLIFDDSSPFAVFLLTRSEYAIAKARACERGLDRSTNSIYFSKIITNGEDHHSVPKQGSLTRLAGVARGHVTRRRLSLQVRFAPLSQEVTFVDGVVNKVPR